MSKARKVKTGAIHKTKEQMRQQRSAAFARRVKLATSDRWNPNARRWNDPQKLGKIEPRRPDAVVSIDHCRIGAPRTPWGFPTVQAKKKAAA